MDNLGENMKIIKFLTAILLIAGLNGCGGSEKVKWSEIELGFLVPEPSSSKGTIYTNSAEELSVYLDNVSDDEYNDYLKKCEKEFTIDPDKSSSSYEAHNEDGYKLRISHIGEQLSIKLEAPMQLSEITWPTGIAGSKIPSPESLIGDYVYEYDDHFSVYVGNTSKEAYNKYVGACANAGFTVDYSKGNNYYRAYTADGWYVSLNYKGFDIMQIVVEAPEEDEQIENEDNLGVESDSQIEEDLTNNESLIDGMRPEFKTAMDSYEAFYNDYCDFIEEYSKNPTDLKMLAKYADMMGKAADMDKAFEEWDEDDMTDEELKYYLEVSNRIILKLSKLGE